MNQIIRWKTAKPLEGIFRFIASSHWAVSWWFQVLDRQMTVWFGIAKKHNTEKKFDSTTNAPKSMKLPCYFTNISIFLKQALGWHKVRMKLLTASWWQPSPTSTHCIQFNK
jgi:hypothetical protein